MAKKRFTHWTPSITLTFRADGVKKERFVNIEIDNETMSISVILLEGSGRVLVDNIDAAQRRVLTYQAIADTLAKEGLIIDPESLHFHALIRSMIESCPAPVGEQD